MNRRAFKIKVTSILALLAAVSVVSCDGHANSTAGPATLPENHIRNVSPIKRDKAIRSSALDFCRVECAHIIQACPGDAVASAQLELVRRLLEDPNAQPPVTPISIFAGRGQHRGVDYLLILGFNWNRETSRLHLHARGADGQTCRVNIAIPLTTKEPEALFGRYLAISPVGWSAFATNCQSAPSGELALTWRQGESVPFPEGDGVSVSFAIEDRTGGCSNYVPVSVCARSDDDSPSDAK